MLSCESLFSELDYRIIVTMAQLIMVTWGKSTELLLLFPFTSVPAPFIKKEVDKDKCQLFLQLKDELDV